MYHFFKLQRTAERAFFTTEPNPIDLFPQRPVHTVRVIGLSVHVNETDYDRGTADWLRKAPFSATCRLGDLRPLPGILVAPLGESPMVVTQTLVLLLEREGMPIEAVALIYPGGNAAIRESARLLEGLLTRPDLTPIRGSRPVEVHAYPLKDLPDIDSAAAGDQYARTLVEALARIQERYPERRLCLSLSGGRKSMAAVTYYAAQQARLREVWHTVIASRALAERVERDTRGRELQKLSLQERASRFFLRDYQMTSTTSRCSPCRSCPSNDRQRCVPAARAWLRIVRRE
jgi:hypothetical protein